MNSTNHKMITTDYEASKKALTINTAESQTAVILIDYSTNIIFNKHSKKTSTIYITESQTATILIDHSTKTMFNEHLKKTFII